MAVRDISVCISSLESDFGLLHQAAALSEDWAAHLSCCAIGIQPAPAYSDGMIGTMEVVAAQFQAGEAEILSFRKNLHIHIQEKLPAVELRETRAFAAGIADVTSVYARYADILVARMPEKPDTARHGEIIEGALFGGGRPVLVLPKDWKPAPLGGRVLFAWDSSREASRAIHDALPLLAPGAEVCVTTIDAQIGWKKHGEAPGLDIAAHLARHGLSVTVRNEDSLGKPVGERLAESAKDFNADLIVMGAYRHSKLAQRLVGGPSHFLISGSPLPVFLSH
jgi:nucleotide-binding universal stress UspA family protein